jgi:hypothetical protein
MTARKRPNPATLTVRLAGKRTAEVEELPDTIAVRCRDSEAEARVREVLGGLGTVREMASQRLLIATLTSAADRPRALAILDRLQDAGDIEFATPVLCDPASRLCQILTDEITVRFKQPAPNAERLRAQYGVTLAKRNEFVPNQYLVKVADARGLKTLEVANRLDSADDVEFAAPNFISEFSRT